LKPVLSIVVPLFNEVESLPELHARLSEVLDRLGQPAEIVFVDDGSTDGSMEAVRRLSARDPRVRGVQFRRRYGKSAALAAGLARAAGQHLVTLDADLQDDPAEIPRLLEKLDEGYDLVSGWKRGRADPLPRRVASRVFNRVTSWLTGVRLHDINCGLKAYRREVTDTVRVYGQLHRFLPVLALKEGFRLAEVEVTHHPRKHGRSKFGVSRFAGGFFDLVTVLFLTRYTRSPLHLFGIAGVITLALGAAISVYLAYQRLVLSVYLSNRPLLFLGILLVIVGVQFISLGLLGEMIAAAAEASNPRQGYGIRSEVGFADPQPLPRTVPDDR
jgi:glycosyltransferase involved in cell wall biosynthesis